MEPGRTAIRTRYTVVPGAVHQEVIRDATVIVEGNTIVAVTREEVTRADEFITVEEGVLIPGFVNLHNHALNGPTLKGITDDYDRTASAGSLIYKLLMPLGDLSTHGTSEEDIRAIYRLALLDMLKSGTTTMLDMWRPAHRGFLAVAQEMGLRAYGAPYVLSTPPTGVNSQGLPTYGQADEREQMAVFREIFDEYDEGPSGRIRIVLGPHGTDTCTPELLETVRRTANELDTLVTIHAAQSQPEVATIQDRYGLTPIEYLHAHGITGPDVIASHCVYASDADLGILRDTGTSVASCPLTFARGGYSAPYQRFADHGIRTGIGTDGYGFDFIEEMRSAGFVSKLKLQQSHVASAAQLLKAGTEDGAAALGRSDLGRIEVGARADLTIVDLGRAGLQPVRDPIKNLIWYTSAPDVTTVMVDGQVLLKGRKPVGMDEATVISAGVEAVGRLWERAEQQGIQL
ncbi:cytosine/adenosine deaminase-related metal-dependent hydrolase [Arthrobacter silviterrae]|uniref:Amidohydrolase family protein n=1 Tax=Arthrobacter silviterrae TaxID=2026658 RepID=A0ABX0DG32_9MICC|nr:amidohydrolase family protein [Arthrobacter silviterrae]MDQ0276451.1 cytosine/adenosine deaminase-related metal-dependent hydrolase [Arthrobacter silviterrae]NGN84711.1 amidohydrolase family protein [Arthrobacter silviterrae]